MNMRVNTAFQRPAWTLQFRRELQYLVDLSALALAFVFAYLLRFEFQLDSATVKKMFVQLPWVVLLQFIVLSVRGIYSFIWHFIGMAEIWSFVRAFGLALIPVLALRFGLEWLPLEDPDAWQVPLSVALIDSILAFGALLGLRVARRSVYERYEQERKLQNRSSEAGGKSRRTLLVGAGRAGITAARELARTRSGEVDLLGFLDDDPDKQGMVVQGLKVLGPTRDLERLAKELQVDQILVTMVEASREALRRLVELCGELDLDVRIMPSLSEILDGRLAFSRFRKVRIEDLLGRDPVQLDKESLARFLAGKRVMVTGAGGSIGSELAQQIARFGPSRLFLAERSEPALFEVHRKLIRQWPELDTEPLLADICDKARMRQILGTFRPQIILHAAAHKHVPLMEINPVEAIKNNVLATHRLGVMAGEEGVERFVLISTDKAVRPTSIMGASKRLAELVIQDLDRRSYPTRFLAVRFGNVLGSTGSVIPIFQEQIENGGPVTVTHPDMVRYFMTIPEAAQLVLQASDLGQGGEIFVLDMGEPVKIVDMARDMVRLAGFEPDVDIEIKFTGPRPGEKLFEELELTEESLARTQHKKIFIGRIQAHPSENIEEALETLHGLSQGGSERALRAYLEELLPEAHLQRQNEIPTRPDLEAVAQELG